MRQKIIKIRKANPTGQLIVTVPNDVGLHEGDFLSFTPRSNGITEIKKVVV